MENRALVLDMVEWIAAEPRAYEDVMAAWRTSCPRLTIWEDALDEKLVVRVLDEKAKPAVQVTAKGRALLQTAGRNTL